MRDYLYCNSIRTFQSIRFRACRKKISATNPTQTTQELAFQSIKIEEKEFPESVPYPKQQQEDDTLTGDQTKLIQAGKDGQKIMIYNVTYDKGKEISRILKSEKVTVEPVPEITAVGKRRPTPILKKLRRKVSLLYV